MQPLLERLGCDFGPDTMVESLSLAQRQLVEIAKALSLQARLVIMDEPTSSLTIAETERLLRVIAGLKADGVSVIFISHRLGEVERCADRVVVLRDGRVAGELEPRAHPPRSDDPADDRARAEGHLHAARARARRRRRCEVIDARTRRPPGPGRRPERARRARSSGSPGWSGRAGPNWRARCSASTACSAGTVRVAGEPFEAARPRAAIERGLYLVPEDRKRAGLLLDVSVAREHLAAEPARVRAGHAGRRRLPSASNAERQKQQPGASACPTWRAAAGVLSGGNQQKVVLAKWLSMRPRVIILDEPTRGIDVGSKSDIYGAAAGAWPTRASRS